MIELDQIESAEASPTADVISPVQDYLNQLHREFSPLSDGKVATYIPELAKMDPNLFGICAVTVDGHIATAGDAERMFTIQSISKPFMFGMALENHGREHVLTRVGVEPTGEAFNSIVLDEKSNRPFNPLVNSGAIATADLIEGRDFPDRVTKMLEMFGRYAGRPVYVDNSVFMSERFTGHRNRAMAHLMLNFGMVKDRVEQTLELYFQQCSVLMNCHDLAVMGATLANGGVNPMTGERALKAEYVKDLLSIMLSCGMYDFAGEWAYRVGLPAKSGVSGGIVVVVPGQVGIGIFSPRLDPRGNSVRGVKVCQELSEQFGLHCFEAGFAGRTLRDELGRK